MDAAASAVAAAIAPLFSGRRLAGKQRLRRGFVAWAETAIEAGRLRGIAVTSLKRNDLLPDIPAIAESGYPGFEALNWFGAVTRSATPRTRRSCFARVPSW